MPTHQLWAELAPDLANEILVSAQKKNRKLYQNALELIGPHLGMREPKILGMPKKERHSTFAQLLRRPDLEVLSFNLISHWLVAEKRELLCAWLNSIGIKHDERGCASEFPDDPGETVLKKAVADLLKEFDPVLVKIYLHAFNEIHEVGWPTLEKVLAGNDQLAIAE